MSLTCSISCCLSCFCLRFRIFALFCCFLVVCDFGLPISICGLVIKLGCILGSYQLIEILYSFVVDIDGKVVCFHTPTVFSLPGLHVGLGSVVGSSGISIRLSFCIVILLRIVTFLGDTE